MYHASLHATPLLLFFFFFLYIFPLLLTLVILLALKSSSVKKPPGPLAMGPINMEEGSKLPSQLLELCSEVGVAFLGYYNVSCSHYIVVFVLTLLDFPSKL